MQGLQKLVAVLERQQRMVQRHLREVRGSPRSSKSSMLGCVAAVMEIESPSQPSPAVIQRIVTSGNGGRLHESLCPRDRRPWQFDAFHVE